jgi:hypothetical protein
MQEKMKQMPDCELLSTCPYFSDNQQEMSEMAARLKEEYCRGESGWCGRYMTYKALEREMERTAAGFAENVTKSIYK